MNTIYMKQKVIIGIVIAIIVIGAIGLSVINRNDKKGYYTYGKNCSSDNDCVCIGTSAEFDTCGKPGQVPACVSGKCGWN